MANAFCKPQGRSTPAMKTSMCIGKRLGLILACLLAWVAFATPYATAHPVAQGALEIVVFPERIGVTATVSMEEVLVAAAYGGQKHAAALEMVQWHGDYLLAHLRVTADGQPLD